MAIIVKSWVQKEHPFFFLSGKVIREKYWVDTLDNRTVELQSTCLPALEWNVPLHTFPARADQKKRKSRRG